LEFDIKYSNVVKQGKFIIQKIPLPLSPDQSSDVS